MVALSCQSDCGARADENGACFMLMTGLELAALGLTGSPEAAYDRFALAMRKFQGTKLWSQNIRWDLGSPTVPEVGGGDVSQVQIQHTHTFC